VYEHFGYFPGGQKSRYGTSESQFADPLVQPGSAVPGALVFFDDGVYANPGHVGVVLNSNSYVGADSPAVGTVTGGLGGNVGFRIPKGGFKPVSTAANVGPVGAGVSGFASALLGGLGVPANSNNIGLIAAWAAMEGGIGHNNPLNTTQNEPGAGTFNSVGVKTYPSMGVGVSATITTLKNGLYGAILGALASGNTPLTSFEAAVQGSPWGTVFYGKGTPSAMPGWGWVGEHGPELVKFSGGETVLSSEQSMAAIGGAPGVGYWQGTAVGTPAGDFASAGSASLKSALRDVEDKLDKLTKATKNVGGDVAGTLNSTGRGSGHSAAFGAR
jgi:hypothetical protein